MGTVRLPARSARREAIETLESARSLAGPLNPGVVGAERWRQLGDFGQGAVGRGLLLLASLGLLELAVAWQPNWRVWVWSAMLLLSGAAAALCVIAGQRHYRFNFAWYAAAGGCLSLLL